MDLRSDGRQGAARSNVYAPVDALARIRPMFSGRMNVGSGSEPVIAE
jgi:hypothetical protein